METKAIFLDVDGTIVNDKGIIPESTQIAIRKAVENGHKLVVCSGRSLNSNWEGVYRSSRT